MSLTVRPTMVDEAEVVLGIVAAAFAARPPLDPPADALTETVETIADALAGGGGLLAELDGTPVGSLLLDREADTVWLRRFAVLPSHQNRGIAHDLVAAAVAAAGDATELAVVAREELPNTVKFWKRQGFLAVAQQAPLIELRRPLVSIDSLSRTIPTAEAMHEFGVNLAHRLRPGDVVVLTGDLGAGKTTLTRGVGEGLGIRGPVTSPTFIIAREHPSLVDGPSLVHVDAYRLGSIDELDDLDLDTELDQAVTIVEWGAGLAESLAESRLEVSIQRSDVAPQDPEDLESDPRRVSIRATGPRWQGVRW